MHKLKEKIGILLTPGTKKITVVATDRCCYRPSSATATGFRLPVREKGSKHPTAVAKELHSKAQQSTTVLGELHSRSQIFFLLES